MGKVIYRPSWLPIRRRRRRYRQPVYRPPARRVTNLSTLRPVVSQPLASLTRYPNKSSGLWQNFWNYIGGNLGPDATAADKQGFLHSTFNQTPADYALQIALAGLPTGKIASNLLRFGSKVVPKLGAKFAAWIAKNTYSTQRLAKGMGESFKNWKGTSVFSKNTPFKSKGSVGSRYSAQSAYQRGANKLPQYRLYTPPKKLPKVDSPGRYLSRPPARKIRPIRLPSPVPEKRFGRRYNLGKDPR